jgi:hypothetical protein
MISSLSSTTLIILAPLIVTLLFIFMLYKKNHGNRSTKRYMYFVFGFVLLALYYITAPDPEVVEAMFISQGNYETPIFWSIISASLLFVAIYVFQKHIGES